MSGAYGTQVLESVAVRRRRLREAWLFGAERAKNTLNEQTGKVLASVMIGALGCAGCAGVAYFKSAQAKETQQPTNGVTTGPVNPSPTK
ncbi:hypothetical protein E1263_18715 [Kribbella antibiotica]|uniref:Uncharacterized protein n=1 Tax=Kribbella antibiotica TaxID=190195 RepID=A0A4R4ZIK9_9ACTN|nr:hypothetical protein [Kribbella antibiotica]TDD58548.1 hypothetical protein E1263_18715 [Kribbella antibiotica]